MITEKDLLEAIAECQGTRDPNANTCIKLAAFYTILDHIRNPEGEKPAYSYDAPPTSDVLCTCDSEFGRLVDGKEQEEVWPVIDELVGTIYVLNPRLYASLIRKLEDL